MIDIIPKHSLKGNPYNEDLKIVDFKLLRLKHHCNTYYTPVYILTDRIPCFNGDFYETMIRVGFHEHNSFLNVQERCFCKLEAYKQHKMIYKKLIKGFYDNEIIKIVESEVSCNMEFD